MAIKGGDPILERQNWASWFFGLCAFLFLCYGAAIYQELVSRRTYIYYQATFREFEHEYVDKELEELRSKSADELQKAAALETTWKQAEEKVHSAEYKKLKAEHHDQYIRNGYVKAERSKVKSFQDAQFYTWKHALHSGDEEKAKAEEETYWEIDVELLGAASGAPSAIEERVMGEAGFKSWDEKLAEESKKLAELEAKIAAIEQTEKDARKAYEVAYAPFKAYEDKLEKIESRSIRNIDQIVNNRLGVGGAYTFGTVDRCRSCHVAIESGYEQSVFTKLEGELGRFKDYDKVYSVHPKRDPLFTNHSIDQVGCTVCHDGQGRATRIKTKWPGQNPDAFVFAHDMDQPHGPAADHGAHQWEFPLLRGDFMQSNCQRCHSEQRWLDAAPVYEKGKGLFIEKGCSGCHAVKGAENFARIGPELTRIKSKVTPEWLVSWIENPKAFYPETRMPMFVFDELQVGAKDPADNVKVMAHPERQSETALKMAAFLWQASAATEPLPFGKFPGGGDAANGKKIIETVGCIGCHNTGEKGNDRAPPLYKAGAKMASVDWIWNWIRDPRWHSETTTMPSLRLSDSEARDVTAWLWAAGASERPKVDAELVKKLEDPALAKAGDLLLAQWGCAACHLIKGHEKDGRIGPELTLFGSKKPFELGFGDSDVEEAWLPWTAGKLHNPRQYVDVRSAARMPWLALEKDEIHALTVYLAGLRNPRVPSDMQKQFVGRNARIERGRELVNQYNCVGCHIIEGRGGEILAINKERSLQPPNLNAEGLKIRSDYLLDFLRAPTTIRPWLDIRMPTFPLSDEERASIVAYFRAVDGIGSPFDPPVAPADPKLAAEGSDLFKKYGCQACHLYKGETRATEATIAPELANVWKRFRPDGVEAWLKAPQKAMPGTNMPAFFFDWDQKTDTFEPLIADPATGKPSADESERQIDALREFLFAQGKGRQLSMNR